MRATQVLQNQGLSGDASDKLIGKVKARLAKERDLEGGFSPQALPAR